MVFLVIGGVSLVVLVLSLVVGDLLDVDSLFDSDFFSLSAIAGFFGAFGFAGAAVDSLTHMLPAAIGVGAVAGLAVAWFTVWLTRTLKTTRTDATPSTRSLVGHEGAVLTAIPADGYGEVTLRVAGHRVKYAARSASPLSEGTTVWVSDVLSPTAVEVRPTDAIEA